VAGTKHDPWSSASDKVHLAGFADYGITWLQHIEIKELPPSAK
jgi:hypothetical protein